MKILFPLMIIISLFAAPANGQPKFSPLVREAMMHAEQSAYQKAKGDRQKEMSLTAFVRTDNVALLKDHDCRILAQWDDIVIASIPLSQLRTLTSLPQVKRIEAGRSCAVTSDTSATITHARDVWHLTAPSPLGGGDKINGKGVVVGVMDIGFDLTHPAFYTAAAQNYRIKRLWDQIDQTLNGEEMTIAGNEGEEPVNIGRQYIGIEMLLSKQHSFDGTEETHGTHTTGIAATMAPETDLYLVANYTSNNMGLVPEEEHYKYTTATDMLGFKYIFDYADSEGKPCVINFSEGAPADLYQDGLYQEVLQKMLGPGHILCASAGNEGISDGTYLHKADGEEAKSAFLAKWASNTAIYVMSSRNPVNMTLSFYENNQLATTWDYDATELAQYPDSLMSDTLTIGDNRIAIFLNTYPSCYDENLYATDFFIEDIGNTNIGYAVPTKLAIRDAQNDVEVFSSGGYFVRNNNIEPALRDYEVTHNILSPGCMKDAICVGATSHTRVVKNVKGFNVGRDFGENGVRADYSSVGPALSGITKPDVMAPGTNIISSLSSFWRERYPDDGDNTDDTKRVEFNSRIYSWGIETGTSMATPVVTGIVALWLQVCPTLTPDQVKDVIAHTSTQYDTSLSYPNNLYGWGQIDALEGLRYIEKVYTGIEQTRLDTPAAVDGLYDLTGRRLTTPPASGMYIKIVNGVTRKVIQ